MAGHTTPNTPQRGTRTDIKPKEFDPIKKAEQKARLSVEAKRQACQAKGMFWDAATQTCNEKPVIDVGEAITEFQEEPERGKRGPSALPPAGTIEASTTRGEGGATQITLPDGRTFLAKLSNEDIQSIARGEQRRAAFASGQPQGQGLGQGVGGTIQPIGAAQTQIEQQIEAERLGRQLGQFGQLSISPTGLDVGEAAITGIVDAIPRALGLAAGAATAVGIGTAATGAGLPIAAPLALAVGAATFVGSVGASIFRNFKEQRTDTTTAQQRVLDEGKQNLNDWATLAASDPVNRGIYVARFNQQLALIAQAYRQMKLDTSRDIAKFETALPNLAEFETFYNLQGERDYLVARMRLSLSVSQDPEFIYQMQELSDRRFKNEER